MPDTRAAVERKTDDWPVIVDRLERATGPNAADMRLLAQHLRRRHQRWEAPYQSKLDQLRRDRAIFERSSDHLWKRLLAAFNEAQRIYKAAAAVTGSRATAFHSVGDSPFMTPENDGHILFANVYIDPIKGGIETRSILAEVEALAALVRKDRPHG